jgi:hypothetical protein
MPDEAWIVEVSTTAPLGQLTGSVFLIPSVIGEKQFEGWQKAFGAGAVGLNLAELTEITAAILEKSGSNVSQLKAEGVIIAPSERAAPVTATSESPSSALATPAASAASGDGTSASTAPEKKRAYENPETRWSCLPGLIGMEFVKWIRTRPVGDVKSNGRALQQQIANYLFEEGYPEKQPQVLWNFVRFDPMTPMADPTVPKRLIESDSDSGPRNGYWVIKLLGVPDSGDIGLVLPMYCIEKFTERLEPVFNIEGSKSEFLTRCEPAVAKKIPSGKGDNNSIWEIGAAGTLLFAPNANDQSSRDSSQTPLKLMQPKAASLNESLPKQASPLPEQAPEQGGEASGDTRFLGRVRVRLSGLLGSLWQRRNP